jgi:hypothetical protein
LARGQSKRHAASIAAKYTLASSSADLTGPAQRTTTLERARLNLCCVHLCVLCCVFDRQPGVGLSHLSGEVKRLIHTLTKYDQDNYPEMLGRICIINAPMVFKAIWALVKPLLNPRTLSKIQVWPA